MFLTLTLGGRRPAWANLIAYSGVHTVFFFFTCSVSQDSSAEHPGSLHDRSRSRCLARRCLGYLLCYFVCYHSAERRSDRCISDPYCDLDICLVNNDDNVYSCRGLPDSYSYFLGIPVFTLSVRDYSFGYPDPSLGPGRAGLRNFSDLAYFSRVLVSFLLTEDVKFHLRVFVLVPFFGVIVHATDTTASFSGSPPDRGFQLIIVF